MPITFTKRVANRLADLRGSKADPESPSTKPDTLETGASRLGPDTPPQNPSLASPRRFWSRQTTPAVPTLPVREVALQPSAVSAFEMKTGVWRAQPLRWPVAALAGAQGHYLMAQALPGAFGGYGELRLGLQADGLAVAIKVLNLTHRPGAPVRVSHMSDVMTEVKASSLAGTEHQPIEVLHAGEQVFVVMPLAEGDLHHVAKRLAAEARPALARSLLAQISPKLAHLHKQGWVHVDIKLENLLWFPDGTMRLTDFGLARPKGSALRDVGGTPHFIAPEVVHGLSFDERADVWSFGLALCDLLADQAPPFAWRADGADRDSPARVGTARFNHGNFEIWRNMLPRNRKGEFDLGALESSGLDPITQQFSHYFMQVRNADPMLCQFVLARMLDPDVSTRASMEEVTRFAQRVQRAHPEGLAQAHAALAARAGKQAEREAILALLTDLQKVPANS